MIARIWSGRVQRGKPEEFLELMKSVALPDYRAVAGNAGAYCLHRVDADCTHVTMLTFWVDRNSIRAFAGDDIEKAKYYDFDSDFLLELPPTVVHYEVEGIARD